MSVQCTFLRARSKLGCARGIGKGFHVALALLHRQEEVEVRHNTNEQLGKHLVLKNKERPGKEEEDVIPCKYLEERSPLL